MMVKPKIGILSLGCCRNLVDSEGILGRLKLKGYKDVDINKADIGIINTCAFIQDAKSESIKAILDFIDLKKQGKLKKVIVYGCLAQRYKNELTREFPEVDAFVGALSLTSYENRLRLTPQHFTYLKICESCINNCSYCIIPKIKSKFCSLPVEILIKEAGYFDKKKVSELNIVGQDISAYGIDLYGKPKLEFLISQILKNTRYIHWFRLLYLYPSRITDDLLKLIRDEKRICKYIDIPIQHINNRILRLMNRKTTKQQIQTLIGKIRKIIPDCAIRTTLITGFPSETDKEFKEVLKFINEVKFDRLGVFVYSKEEGTKAFNLGGDIPSEVKKERFNILMLRQQEIANSVNQKFLGRDIEVLIEETDLKSHDGCYLGRTQYDAPEVDGLVYVKSRNNLKPGQFVRVNINDTLEYDLVGEHINEYSK